MKIFIFDIDQIGSFNELKLYKIRENSIQIIIENKWKVH